MGDATLPPEGGRSETGGRGDARAPNSDMVSSFGEKSSGVSNSHVWSTAGAIFGGGVLALGFPALVWGNAFRPLAFDL